MTLSFKEKILCVAVIAELIMHMDVWAWDRIQPVWLGAFPYHFLWGTLEVIVILLVFLWWGFYQWEDLTNELAIWKENRSPIYRTDWPRNAKREG